MSGFYVDFCHFMGRCVFIGFKFGGETLELFFFFFGRMFHNVRFELQLLYIMEPEVVFTVSINFLCRVFENLWIFSNIMFHFIQRNIPLNQIRFRIPKLIDFYFYDLVFQFL